jgi:hypothetical protein
VLLLGRRRAIRFVAVAAVSLAVVAGPWWIYQASRFGNPIQSNLDRPGYMLPHGEPRTFYVSFPLRDLVSHPYRDRFSNELLPKFHADLWSDWFGVDRDYWQSPSHADRIVASTQSVLGLGGDLLALGGLVAIGIPAVVLAWRRRREEPVAATLAIVVVLSFVAYVATLVRFPQASGDPIKSSYLLFLAPAFALFGVAAGRRLWERGAAWRVALAAWSGLYCVSFGILLLTTY